jgi:Fasciclin domain
MFKKLLLLTAALLITATAQADSPDDHAHVRFMPLVEGVQAVSVTLQDGTTALTNLASGTVSDMIEMDVNRSTFIILGITPANNSSTFFREWSLPPLAPGTYTAALVGSLGDNTLNMIVIDENRVCEAETTCLIVVNNIRNSPTLSVIDGPDTLIDGVQYRQAAAVGINPATFWEFASVVRDNAQSLVFAPQTLFFEPNTVYLYGFMGDFAGRRYLTNAARRVTTDVMTFLRGLTVDVQLTDGEVLFATENIVAVLEQSGYDSLLANPYLDLTVFAPTDGAILEAVPELFGCVTSNPDAMQALILHHIVIGGRTPAELVEDGMLTTMGGGTHTFAPAADGGFLIDHQIRVDDGYPAENGIVYRVDSVLVPDGFMEQYCEVG